MSEETETIINSIDVSECKFYEPKAQKMTCHEEAITKPCESTPICYYKLLQKSYIEIQRLQEENEKLKEKNKELLNLANKGGALLVAESTKNKKYEQALEEIREILMCKIYGLNENASQLDYMCYALDKFEKIRIKILTKIDEVLNDRD